MSDFQRRLIAVALAGTFLGAGLAKISGGEVDIGLSIIAGFIFGFVATYCLAKALRG